MSVLKRFVKAVTSSKKAMVALGTFVFGMVAPSARRAGLDISPADVDLAIKIGIGYIVGQGIADNGKSAKQIEIAHAQAMAKKE
jgi:hypothetical protein